MKTNFLCGPSVALISIGCLGANLGACSSTSCADTDSCGAYQPPDVCDGGAECADGAVDTAETGVVPRADAGVDANRDIAVDGAGAVVDAQDLPDSGDATDPVAPDTGTDSGRDAAGDADADVGPNCDVRKSPVDEPCVVDDRYGVFVSPGGSDSAGVGTKASPYASVTKGLTAAQGKNVYVCAATYTEAVTVEGSLDGTRLFGGFDCLSWVYASSNRPVVKPASGSALVVKTLTKGLRIEDMEFDAPATTTSGESSVGVWVTGSANVQLVRVKLVAAAAQAGAAGMAATNYDPLLQQSDAKIAGHAAVGRMGGGAQACVDLCTNGQHSTGGQGGNGAPGVVGDAGVDGGAPTGGADGGPPITPASPPGATGAGGAPKTPSNIGCDNGVLGSDAPAKPGGAGAMQPGTLTASGWTRTDATPGTTGGPGQGGGGGGGGQNATMGGGGGGGCGGCGGAAGLGGQSGGSSLALLSYQSTVTLDACVLVAGAGGNGAQGADGQTGQLGGAGGVPTSFGCLGGAGGQGGEAGGGGGGAGGHSVAIGYAGLPPTQMNGTTMNVAGQAAAAGPAGTGGSPGAIAGAVGKAQNILELL